MAIAASYFVAANGSDDADGRTADSAWGGIQVSSVDDILTLEGSQYVDIDGLAFSYANHYCVRGGASDNKRIDNSAFER